MENHEKKLRQEILNEANQRADRIVARGKKDADNTVKKAKTDSAARRKKRIADAEAEAQEKFAEMDAEMAKVMNGMWLSIRESCIESLFVNWSEEQMALPGGSEKRMNYLRFLIGEAVESINCPQITLKVTKTDMPFITEEWLKSFFPDTKFTVTEGKKIKLGIIAESADGRMVYDNSLNAIIKRKREAVRRQVAEKSFMDLLNEKL